MRAARPVSLVLAALALSGTVAACSGDHGGPSAASVLAAASGRDADVAFAQLMIPHHEQAVEMADMALAGTAGAEVRRLATQIKAAQAPEIAQMTAWLSEWGAPTRMPGQADDGSMDHGSDAMGGMDMAGMMTEEEMSALASASGADFDRRWLTMMIEHHEGAITMAEQVKGRTSEARVRALADAIVAAQRDEIVEMRRILAPTS